MKRLVTIETKATGGLKEQPASEQLKIAQSTELSKRGLRSNLFKIYKYLEVIFACLYVISLFNGKQTVLK